MKRILLLFMCCTVSSLMAQTQVRTEQGTQGKTVDFILDIDKGYAGTMTVFITFTSLQNCNNAQIGTTKYEVPSSGMRFLTLRPVDVNKNIAYRSSSRYFLARINSPVDTSFVYRMPVSSQSSQRVLHTVAIMGKEKGSNLGYSFHVEKGDTVYAVRKGIVTKIDRAKGPVSSEIYYSTESTDVFVEHSDGTIARYICLDLDNLFVKEGDVVYTDTPLALAGTYDGEKYRFSLQVYHYVADSDLQESPDSKTLTPYFATTVGTVRLGHGDTYTPLVNEALITREMTKKELKKYNNNKK